MRTYTIEFYCPNFHGDDDGRDLRVGGVGMQEERRFSVVAPTAVAACQAAQDLYPNREIYSLYRGGKVIVSKQAFEAIQKGEGA